MRKPKEKTLLYRDVETVKKIVQMYKDMELDFCIKNSSYSTVIETATNQVRFITNNYSNAVFMAAQKIKADVTRSELGQAIMKGTSTKAASVAPSPSRPSRATLNPSKMYRRRSYTDNLFRGTIVRRT